MVYKNLTEIIGNTPLIELDGFCKQNDTNSKILGKAEFLNPCGSVKDRIAFAMIDKARKAGLIDDNTVIIEPTSGNTGIAAAAVCAALGHRIIITMPETMSVERQEILKIYGAELYLTAASLGMRGAIEKAQQLKDQIPNSFILGQFENPINPKMHYITTGEEIYRDCNDIDYFVAGVGTGGTISGAGSFLKSKIPKLLVVAVEPKASAVLSGNRAGAHSIQGIGAGFIPKTLDVTVYDEVITVSDEQAIRTAQQVARTDGLLLGVSSGAALFAAMQIAKRTQQPKTIVVVLPDTGQRCLSLLTKNDFNNEEII